jgi:mono/diheme cytochrome c family protein
VRRLGTGGAIIVSMLAMTVGTGLATDRQAAAARAQTPAAPDGAALYRAYCASCHGTSGRGDGPVAEFLRIPPTDLTSIAIQAGGAFPADRVHRAIDGRQRIRGHGATDMPVWGDTLSPSLAGRDEAATRTRIDALVAYIASMQRKMADASAVAPVADTR